MSTVSEMFDRVSVAVGHRWGGLQVFGLQFESPGKLDYSTLDEAMSRGELEVHEVSEGGSVPTLKVANKSATRVFLMAGEHLIGAKQNRVLNTSIMVEKGSEVAIPVSCVERGRWSYRTRQFGSGGTTSHGKLRQMMNKSVTESYMACAAPMSNQGEVWKEVSRKLDSMGSVSSSHAMEQVYEDHAPKLETFASELTVPDGCAGAAFALNGHIVGVDLFDNPETLKKLWPKLIRGYAVDAMEEAGTGPIELSEVEVRSWLRDAGRAEPKAFPSPGLGEDIRLKGEKMAGATLVVESQPVHTQLFADVGV